MSIRLIASVVIAALLMTGGVVTATQVTEYGVQPTLKATLTKEEAKAIALEHAGLTETQVTGLRIEYDAERVASEWDIDFRSGDWEYDYEINAETGSVTKGKKEYDPVKVAKLTEPAPSKPAQTQPTETKPAETQPPKTEKLSAEEAKTIALKHAGLKVSQVKGLRAEYDVDDGVPEWDVEFYADGIEYDYEIHAETGKIRAWDKDRED